MTPDTVPLHVRLLADWLRSRGWQDRPTDRVSLVVTAAALLRVRWAVSRNAACYSEWQARIAP